MRHIGQGIAYAHRYAMMKNGGKQAFSARWRMAKHLFLFLCHPDNRCQVKQMAIGRHQGFSQFIHRAQRKGGEASPR